MEMCMKEKAVVPSRSSSVRSGLLQPQMMFARDHDTRVAGAARHGLREPMPVSPPREEAVLPILHEVLGSHGTPLDPATRAFFEPRLGHDFARVRVHADANAAVSAQMLHARAYAVGPHIVFAANHYAPGTAQGRRLLAHELVHVVQQSGHSGDVSGLARVSSPGEAAEVEADTISAKMTGNSSLHVGGVAQMEVRSQASPAVVHRDAQPWPLNGYVINNSDKPVVVWSDGNGLYTIAAGKSSGRFTEDVDHIMDRGRQWYKIGPNTVTVAKDGTISGYKCAVDGPGKDCP